MKHSVIESLNTKAETCTQAVDVIKLIIVSLHAVKSSDMHEILEGVTSDDQQRCHDLTPLPKKRLSYLLLLKESIKNKNSY
jgi:hypothetical protein